MEKETAINQRVHDFSKSIDIMQTILIYLIALLVPTFLGEILKDIFPATSIVVTKSQLIIGSIVNASLIVAAMNLKGWVKILGVVTMPSISTILGGYVFKTASVFMVYMIPAIWIGNFALVYTYKKNTSTKKQKLLFSWNSWNSNKSSNNIWSIQHIKINWDIPTKTNNKLTNSNGNGTSNYSYSRNANSICNI